eukprot:jgi/Botrbrau1/19632/Bobra.0003s0002.1
MAGVNQKKVMPNEVQPHPSEQGIQASEHLSTEEGWPPPKNAWNISGIKWSFLALNLPWAHVLLTFLLVVIPTAVVHVTIKPRIRPFRVYDATISYPLHPDTVPPWAAYVVPLAVFLLTMLVVELWLHRRQNLCLTNALSRVIYFMVDCLCAFATTALVTEVSKREVGFLRPYFLSACQPLPNKFPESAQVGLAPSPFCSILDNYSTNDGRVSFPSGHSSVSAAIQFFNAGYCLWSLLFRLTEPAYMDAFTFSALFLRDLLDILAVFWILAMQSMAWVIMLSRIIDFRHHPADAIAGYVLGAIVGVIWIIHSVATVKYRPYFCPRKSTVIFKRWKSHPQPLSLSDPTDSIL